MRGSTIPAHEDPTDQHLQGACVSAALSFAPPCAKLTIRRCTPVMAWRAAVPLSEDEQRILSEIEQRLYESDPQLVREVSSTTVYTHAIRSMKWATVGFVLGIAILLVTLSISFVLAFVGFLVMLASALVFERNARHMGKAGIQQMSRHRGGDSGGFGNLGQRVRDRFRRPEDED